MSERTLDDLKQKQALPLSLKVRLTMDRIRQWVNEFGEDGVYVSFSGGKDSTVLLDIVRNKMGYKDIPAVFVDVPTQYPELKEFVKSFDNVEIIKPSISFTKVCEQYGFPLISKEVSECVSGARKYLREIIDRQTDRQIIPYRYRFEQITGTGKYQTKANTPNADAESLANPTRGGWDNKYRKLRGIGEYSKRTDAQSSRRGESEISNNAGNVDEGQSNSGEYP